LNAIRPRQSGFWRFPRSDLLNRRKLPWGAVRNPPVVAEIVKYMRRHISNVGGFRGVHYDCQTDYYRVLIYNGRWVEWLRAGDELPGGSSPIWFSDLAQAVNARDKYHGTFRELLPRMRILKLMRARRREDIIASRSRYDERIRTEQGGWEYGWE
jgi:hypothetical protein